MALTMAGSSVDVWALIAQNTVREGAAVDLSDSYGSVLHIDAALGTAAAHIGSKILVQVSSAAADDEFWTTIHDFVALVGTNEIEPLITDDPLAAGSTHLHVASTTNYEVGLADGGTILAFVLDNTVANSELVRIVSCVNDASLDILDGTKRNHTLNTSVLSCITATFAIELPMGTLRARVVVDNTYDINGCTVYSRTRVSKVTAVA